MVQWLRHLPPQHLLLQRRAHLLCRRLVRPSHLVRSASPASQFRLRPDVRSASPASQFRLRPDDGRQFLQPVDLAVACDLAVRPAVAASARLDPAAAPLALASVDHVLAASAAAPVAPVAVLAALVDLAVDPVVPLDAVVPQVPDVDVPRSGVLVASVATWRSSARRR